MSYCESFADSHFRSNGESGLATFTSYASAFFTALTPAENRIENMSPVTSPTSPTSATSKRSSVIGGGRGGAGNYGYATYQPKSRNSTSPIPSPVAPAIASPSQAHVKDDHLFSGYHGRDYYPEMPIASGSSSSGASGSGASSSRSTQPSPSSWV